MDVCYCDWQLPAIANEWFFVCWMIIRRINLRTFLLSMTLDHSCRMLVCKLTNCMMPFHLLWGFVFYSSCVAATWSISQRLLQSFDWMLFTCWFGANLRNKKNGRVLLLKMAKKFKIIIIEIVNDYLRNNYNHKSNWIGTRWHHANLSAALIILLLIDLLRIICFFIFK